MAPTNPGLAGAKSLDPGIHHTPERLVGVGFRCWLAGYESESTLSLDYAWNYYATQLGACRARVAISELGLWVQTIKSVSGREITFLAPACAGFCRDECVAISMIAASQHKVCPALRACAVTLIGCSELEPIMSATDRFAMMLTAMNQRLASASICTVPQLQSTLIATKH